MKKYICKIIALCLAIFVFVPVIECYAVECYWYCKRNKEHKQPVCDSSFDFMERYGGIYVDKNHGDENQDKVIYLTFDVGYENGNVAKIMDVMKEEGVKGTFFILGNVIDREPELVKRMVNEGHVVANHTLTHKNLAGKSESEFREEIETLEKKYKDLTGKEISKFFRPPEGTFDQKMLEYANKMGYKTVFWSFAYTDWDNNSQMSEKSALKKIIDNIHNGEIMLLHPTSVTNAKIMKSLITELKSMGYRFSTLEELK